jgi:hypothetical protein
LLYVAKSGNPAFEASFVHKTFSSANARIQFANEQNLRCTFLYDVFSRPNTRYFNFKVVLFHGTFIPKYRYSKVLLFQGTFMYFKVLLCIARGFYSKVLLFQCTFIPRYFYSKVLLFQCTFIPRYFYSKVLLFQGTPQNFENRMC